MPALYVIGKSLLHPDEVFNQKFSGELKTLGESKALKKSTKIIGITQNAVPAKSLDGIRNEFKKNFKDIGIGKPLSVEIATVYTGKYRRFLGGKKDALVVSGVKSAQTFQATSKAVNLKAQNINENDFLQFGAFEDGTRTVFYSPAMDAQSTLISFELMFDNFDTSLFETLSGLLASAAGVPVFLPAAAYLLGGSQLIKIGSELGDTIFSGSPSLAGTITVEFDSPIIPDTEPKEFVIYNEIDKTEFENLEVGLFDGRNPVLRLVDKGTMNEYKGDAPYMIVLLNGEKRQDLEAFTSTIASAALLKKFYGASDKTGEITTVLQDAMKLYNDSSYRIKGERLKKQLESLPKDSEEFKKLKNLYDAYAANIETDNFKLPSL